MDKRPIGVFDSGLGGLTVVKALKNNLPNESVLYFGDIARLPYGVKSRELIIEYSIQITEFLIQKGAKLIIVACNTATAMALKELRLQFKETKIIGVIEPGSQQAILDTSTKRIGVIGTDATINSRAYESSLLNIDNKIHVISKACPLFVPFVEEGMITGSAINYIVEHYLSSFQNDIDTMILGCTHYPLLKDAITRYTKNIKLVDSASATAKEANIILKKYNLKNTVEKSYILDCFVTDLPMKFERLGKTFLGEPVGHPQLVNDI
ncbi:glutamate racemase [Candidatus Marinimicrobia bacterium]|nr:glutamate racemase [Candidatus Neomarinimicrobiota bacterium]